MKVLTNIFRLSISALVIGSALSGCTAIREDSTADGPVELRFRASVGTFQVKATDTAFEVGDAVGLFADAPVNARNVRMDWDGANLVPQQKLFWMPGQERTTFFTAYYPYSADVTGTWARFCVNADQSTHELYTASDLMAAHSAQTSPDGLVSLEFYHALSKIVIYLDNNIEGAEIADVYLSNVFGRYECDLANCGPGFYGNVIDKPGTIKAGKVTTAEGATAWTLIIPPQTVSPNLIVTTTDGRQYTGWPGSDIWFGSSTRYSVQAVLDGESVLTDFTAEVTEWTDNNDIAFPGYNSGISTVSDVINGPEGEEYTVTGRISRIANANYGNFYIYDETGELYIYGTRNSEGLYPRDAGGWYTESFGLALGDLVTVVGPKTLYKETPELVDVKLLQVEYASPALFSDYFQIPGEEGSVYIPVRYNGGNLKVESAPEWISLAGNEPFASYGDITWSDVQFYYAANPNTDQWRYGQIVLSDGNNKTYLYIDQNPGKGQQPPQPSYGDGSFNDPYSVTQAIEVVNALGADVPTDTAVYVSGIVSRIKEEFGSTYGNATFWISDDGSESNELMVYRTMYFGGRKWDVSDDEYGSRNIKVGDKVILRSPLVNYKGTTPETVAYQCKVFGIQDNSEFYVNAWIPELLVIDHTWYGDSDWSGGLEAGISMQDGNFTFTLPQGLGGSEWMGQNYIVLKGIGAPDAGTECSFSCLLTSESGASSVATIKLSQIGDDTNADKEILYDSNVGFGSQFIARDLRIPSGFDDDMVCILDLGRCTGGDTVTMSNVSWVFRIGM